jgi:hypothetical protein
MANHQTNRADTRAAQLIAALLAPLPPKEEQAATKRFIASLTEQMKERWEVAMRDVDDTNRARNRHRGFTPESREAERAHLMACHRQMLIPAPGRAALKWKKDSRKYDGGRDAWEAAIVRDEEWLGAHL